MAFCKLVSIYRTVSYHTRGRLIVSVGNIRCGGNDLRLGFYAAEWNSLGGDTMFVLSGDEHC